jgi:hypothetical protein
MVRLRRLGGTLADEAVLPGFSTPVAAVFPPPDEPEA